MTTLERIQDLLAQKFALTRDQLQPESQLDGIGVDSLAALEFMFVVEDEFKIRMPEERLEIRTVQDIVAIVETLASKQHGKAA